MKNPFDVPEDDFSKFSYDKMREETGEEEFDFFTTLFHDLYENGPKDGKSILACQVSGYDRDGEPLLDLESATRITPQEMDEMEKSDADYRYISLEEEAGVLYAPGETPFGEISDEASQDLKKIGEEMGEENYSYLMHLIYLAKTSTDGKSVVAIPLCKKGMKLWKAKLVTPEKADRMNPKKWDLTRVKPNSKVVPLRENT